jgi:hypothetical protein
MTSKQIAHRCGQRLISLLGQKREASIVEGRESKVHLHGSCGCLALCLGCQVSNVLVHGF